MLIRRKHSPYWWAVLYAGGNKRKWYSTKCTGKKEARIIHDKLQDKLRKERDLQHLDRILGIEPPPLKPEFPVGDIWKRYIALKPNFSETSRKNFERFRKWLVRSHPEIRDCREISRVVALEYMAPYMSSAAKTFNNNRGTLSAVWNALRLYEVENVWELLPARSGEAQQYRPFTRLEVKAILEAATGFWRDAVIISCHTGLRLKDIALLRWDDVDLAREIIEKKPFKTARYNRSVYIHLHREVLDVLRNQTHESEMVFPAAARQYGYGCFQVQFPEILSQCNITDNERGKASFHSLRATFITNCEQAGVDRKVTQGIVGHKSPHMTEHYTDDLESGRVIKNLPGIVQT